MSLCFVWMNRKYSLQSAFWPEQNKCRGWPLQWVCVWKQKPGKYKGWSVGLLLTILTALNVRHSMVKVMTSVMLSNCLGSGSSEHRLKESKDSPGGSRGWQISSTASSTFLVAGQSSPGCHHWICPPLKYMMEIADVQHKTQWNTVFAKLARHIVWCITAGHLIMVFFLSQAYNCSSLSCLSA